MEPTIERRDSIDGRSVEYLLRVPLSWVIATRWPRLGLSYWLLRMVWGNDRSD